MDARFKCVTLTGADDNTPITKEGISPDMAWWSGRFPFIEWGILFRSAEAPRPRYPSLPWIEKAAEIAVEGGMRLSAHLCGKWAREAVKTGKLTRFEQSSTKQSVDMSLIARAFSRVQLNLGKKLPEILQDEDSPVWELGTNMARSSLLKSSLILGGELPEMTKEIVTRLDRNFIELLPDASGGRGVLADEWLPQFVGRYARALPMGYAGGLSPDNLPQHLPRILDAVVSPEAHIIDAPFWIDMESSLRDVSDQFDLRKCERVAEYVAEYCKNH